mgnify:CR=1 FL=1
MATKSEVLKKLVTKKATRMVPLDENVLKTDRYQRGTKEKHKLIIAEFCEEALGIPLIAQREDSTLWIVDGFQRITALRKMGWKHVKAEVFASQGPEHEAVVFKLVNMNRTKLDPREEFNALLIGQDETAWAIKECAEKCGYKICLSKTPKSDPAEAALKLTCCAAMMSIVKKHGIDSLEFSLTTVKLAWPGDRHSSAGNMLKGVSLWYYQQGKLVDTEKLIPRLQTVKAYQVLYSASMSTLSCEKSYAVAAEIDKLYQKRLRGNRT